MKNLIVTLLFAVVISACAGTSSKIACVDNEWYSMGYDYASKGKSVRTFDQYRDQCGDSLEEDAMSEYLDGYAEGLVEYCTFQKGYERGVNNGKPLDICPMEMRDAYVKGYKTGKAEFEAKMVEMEREKRRRTRKQFDDMDPEKFKAPGNMK